MKKTLLKSLLMTVCVVFFLNACNSDELTETVSNEDFVTLEENPYVLEETFVLSETASFLQSMHRNNPDLRSAIVDSTNYEVKVKKVKTILTEKSTMSKQVAQEIPVYIVQYKDQTNKSAGYTVTVGDNRFDDKVIIFNDKGEFADFDDNEFWKERIEGYIYNMVNTSSVDWEISLRTANNPIYFMHSLNWGTSWHLSGKPYTDSTPFRNGVRASVGCCAVAIGQIMAYHRWPQLGAYERYEQDNGIARKVETFYSSYNWAMINNDRWNYKIPTGLNQKAHISNLLAEIAYKLNTDFKSSTLSLARNSDVTLVLRQMGYNCDKLEYMYEYRDPKDPYNSTYKDFFEKIRKDIVEYKRPVFMAGMKSATSNDGHAFIIEGLITNGTQNLQDLKTVEYMYIINGNGGSGDAWYLSSLFIKPGYPPLLEYDYVYKWTCSIITGICPDYNNAGSNSLYRVSNINPY